MSGLSIDSGLITSLRTAVSKGFSIDISKIKSTFVTRAIRWVQSEIDHRGFNLTLYPTADWSLTHYMLYEAALWFLCELLANAGIIAYRPGEISEEQLGKLRLRYATRQPIFFFFGKSVEKINYERLITHESWRMLAAAYVDKFHHDYMRGNIRKFPARAQVATDDDYYNWVNN